MNDKCLVFEYTPGILMIGGICYNTWDMSNTWDIDDTNTGIHTYTYVYIRIHTYTYV